MNFLTFGLLLVLQLASIYANLSAPETERQALVQLYQATNGPRWFRRDNWLQGDPCLNEWYGITCGEDQQGRLTITEM